MSRSLRRLVPATIVLFVVGGTLGFLMSYALETPPFDRAKSIDPEQTPVEVLQQLVEARRLSSKEFRIVSSEDPKSMPVSSGGTGIGSVRTNLGEVKWAQVRMEEDYEGPNYIYSWILLRKFSDVIQPRVALIRLARESRFDSPYLNPIQGFTYSSGYWDGVVIRFHTKILNWVDGVWLASVLIPDDRYEEDMLRHFPYVRTRDQISSVQMLGVLEVEQKIVVTAIGMAIAALVWPVVASRASTLRSSRSPRLASAAEMEKALLSSNANDPRWTVSRAGDNEFVTDWEARERTWQDLFGRNGMTGAIALRLRVDSRRKTVKVAEEKYRLTAKGKWRPDTEIQIRRRPIVRLDLNDWNHLAGADRDPDTTQVSGSASHKSYDASLMKRRIAEAVLKAGWSYQPVIFMRWS